MARQQNLANKINERVQTQFRDTTLEYQLMAYLVRVNPAASSIVRREWFTDELLQDMYTVIREHRAKCTEEVIVRRVKAKYKTEDPELIEDCAADVFAAKIDNLDEKGGTVLIDTVMRLYESTKIVTTMADVITNLKEFDLDEVKENLRDLARPVGFFENVEEGYYLDDFGSRWETIKNRQKMLEDSATGSIGIPTGIHRFDNHCGGIIPKEFGVIAGTTGVGKTAGIIDFGVHAWLGGYNTVLASGEMSKEELQFRVDMHLSDLDGMKFRKAELDEEDYKKWATMYKYYSAMNDGPILYTAAFNSDFTTEHIENIIIRLEEDTGKKIHWLGLDYLNIMSSSENRGDDRDWESQANVVWDIKRLTQERSLVTWTANQVKDEAFDKELFELSDLKYARAISEAAPVVVALIRSDTDIAENRMKLQVLKMRNAVVPAKPILLYPDMSRMKLDRGIPTGVKSLADMKTGRVKSRTKRHVQAARDVRRKT